MSFAETFKALSDPVRREILMLLRSGRMSAGEIAGHFDMTGATISYHLSILKKADLFLKLARKTSLLCADYVRCRGSHALAVPAERRKP